MSDKIILQNNNKELSSIISGLPTDLIALKKAIELKGGTVTMLGEFPTLAELKAGVDSIVK